MDTPSSRTNLLGKTIVVATSRRQLLLAMLFEPGMKILSSLSLFCHVKSLKALSL